MNAGRPTPLLTKRSGVSVTTSTSPSLPRLLEVPDVADVEQVEDAVAVDDPLAERPEAAECRGQVFQREEFAGLGHARASLHGGTTASCG